jgi:hypothetical protein
MNVSKGRYYMGRFTVIEEDTYFYGTYFENRYINKYLDNMANEFMDGFKMINP